MEGFSQVRAEAIRELGNRLFQSGVFDTFFYPFHVDIRLRLGNICRQTGRKQGVLLKHGGEQAVIVPSVKLPDILAVQQHPALGGVQQAAEELHQRRFSRAVEAHNGQLFSRMDGQIHTANGVLFRLGIAKGHIFQPQRIALETAGNCLALFHSKGLRPFQKFPNAAKLPALPVQRDQAVQNGGDPDGKACHRRKLQQEQRRALSPVQGSMDKIGIGNAVSRQRQQHVRCLCPQETSLPAAAIAPV